MLEKIDLKKKLDKKLYREKFEELSVRLSGLQRELKAKGVPVMILFEGLQTAGKGMLINHLIEPLDPRGFRVYAINGESDEEQKRPFLWRFWTKTPEKGKIVIFDRSWYRSVLSDRFDKITSKHRLGHAYQDINSFEKQLADGGTLIIKFFLFISKDEQKKRLKKLLSSDKTSWRVTRQDLKRHEEYEKYVRMNDEMLQATDTEWAPWHIIEAENREYAVIKILSAVTEYFEKKAEEIRLREPVRTDGRFFDNPLRTSVLDQVDLTKTISREEYKKELKSLQKKISLLHSELYARRVPVILGFEGWDAGGKGGAIKRLTEKMDPRGYTVNPTSAPNDLEKAHHYLWRFWNNVPKDGHIAIFDRTWYGRVMVERIEGFCSTEEWLRAYQEINQMEKQWAVHGAVVLKFWLHIDKDEQERRFRERMDNPNKQWKITDEDWRNREKWDLYKQAVDEMLIKTSTTYAPWIAVEGNCKYHARIKVLETVVDAVEKRLREC